MLGTCTNEQTIGFLDVYAIYQFSVKGAGYSTNTTIESNYTWGRGGDRHSEPSSGL